MDAETEYQVMASLSRLLKNKTSLIIAHRLSTVRSADLIVVLRTVDSSRQEHLRNSLPRMAISPISADTNLISFRRRSPDHPKPPLPHCRVIKPKATSLARTMMPPSLPKHLHLTLLAGYNPEGYTNIRPSVSRRCS